MLRRSTRNRIPRCEGKRVWACRCRAWFVSISASIFLCLSVLTYEREHGCMLNWLVCVAVPSEWCHVVLRPQRSYPAIVILAVSSKHKMMIVKKMIAKVTSSRCHLWMSDKRLLVLRSGSTPCSEVSKGACVYYYQRTMSYQILKSMHTFTLTKCH